MKPIALSLAVLVLCSAAVKASQHSDDCNKIRKAEMKLYYVVNNAWGANKGNFNIFQGAANQAKSDIDNGKKWAAKLAGGVVDRETGDPVDCGPVSDKHADFLKAYEELVPKFEEAARTCADLANASNDKCSAAVKEVYTKARGEFISSRLMPFVEAEKAGPLACRARTHGFMSGAVLLSNGKAPEPCARPLRNGMAAICSNIPLKNMRDAADDACKDYLSKIKDPALGGARVLCRATNEAKGFLESLRRNFNNPNDLFFSAAITAAVTRQGLLDMQSSLCTAAAPPDDGGGAATCPPGTHPVPVSGSGGIRQYQCDPGGPASDEPAP